MDKSERWRETMILTVVYPARGRQHVYRNLSQRDVNKLITNISDCQDTVGEEPIRATVEDDLVRRAVVLDFHAGERE